MAREYTLRMTEHGISRWRYRELKAICMQYEEYCRTEYLHYGDPEQEKRRKHLCVRKRAIERAAEETDPALAGYIIRHVSRGVNFERLGIPCGKNQFSQLRRRFFATLDRLV